MKKYIDKFNDLNIPDISGKLALFFSVFALAIVASANNTKCLSANTCAVGSNPTFEQNIGLKGGTAYTATLDASLLTNDRNIQLPDTDGTLAVTATLSGNKILRTNVSGEIEVDTTTYPVTLSPDLPLYTSATGEVTAGAFDVTALSIGAGTSNQVLTVNSGGTALTFDTITGVPSLTPNKPLIADGLGALTTATLTADQIMVTDVNGNLSTTTTYPLSFSANKPVVTDGAGNLTDVTLTADTPMKTDGNGNTSASDLDITTDITPGTALQEIRVNAGGTALEYYTPSGGGGVGAIIGSGTIVDYGNSNRNACFYSGTLPNSTPVLDSSKRYTFRLNSDNIRYAQAISNGGAPNIWFQIMYGDASNNIGRGCDDYTNGAYGTANTRWNLTWDKQLDTCTGTYYRSNNYTGCQYQSGNSPNYWEDSFCVLGAGSNPASSYSAFDYLYFDQYEINFGSLYSGDKGTGITFTGGGGFSDVDTGNSAPKNTWSVAGTCQNFTNNDFEDVVGFRFGIWNDSNIVWNEFNWTLIEFN